jgi:hypothetical protein
LKKPRCSASLGSVWRRNHASYLLSNDEESTGLCRKTSSAHSTTFHASASSSSTRAPNAAAMRGAFGARCSRDTAAARSALAISSGDSSNSAACSWADAARPVMTAERRLLPHPMPRHRALHARLAAATAPVPPPSQPRRRPRAARPLQDESTCERCMRNA